MIQVSNYFKRLLLNIYFNTENSLINGNEEIKKETENILNISEDVNEDEMNEPQCVSSNKMNVM